ncbi:MAG: tetratricopeptide repeat protein, partial [Planctomycetota bacterium]
MYRGERRMEIGKTRLLIALVFILTSVLFVTAASAQSPTADTEAIAERYLQVLLSRPRLGTAVGRVYTHHLQNDSLESLFERLETDGDTESDARKRMARGLIELHRGDNEQAVEFLKVAVEQLPDNPLSSFYLGKAQAALGEIDAAAEAMQMAIDRKPARADALEIFTTLGKLYSKHGRKDEALAVWEQLDAFFPKDPRVGGKIAKGLAEDGRFQLARERFLELAKSAKQDAEKLQFKIEAAEMLRRNSQRDQANVEFESILAKLRPGSWLHEDVIARIEAGFLSSNDYSGLADYYEQRLAEQEDLATRVRLGRIRIVEGKLTQARTTLEKAVEIAPNDATVRLALVDLLQQSFESAAAAEQLKILAEQDPGNPDYILRWGKALLEDSDMPLAERRDQAANVWKQLADANPEDAVKLALVADRMRSIQREKDAVGLYRQAIEAAPEEPQYREYLGEYFHELGRDEDAMETWQSIAAAPRRNRQSLVRLAEILSVFELPDKSLEIWKQASELDLTLDERMRYAFKLREATRYPDAFRQLALAEQAAETGEESERVFLATVETHVEADSLRDYIAEFAKSDPTPEILRKLAVMWSSATQLDEARRAIKRAEELAPESVAILTTAVEIADQQGRIVDAAEKLKRLATVDQRFRPNHLKRLADLQLKLVQVEDALKTCRELIAATPASAESYSFFAKIAFEAKRDEQAIDALRQALRIAPRDNLARRRLAQALADRFRTEEAIELYFEALRLENTQEDRGGIVALLAPLYQRLNDSDRLFQRLEAFGREIGDPRVASLLAVRVHETTGNTDEARKRIENLLISRPHDLRLLAEAVRLSLATQKVDRAVTYQQRLNEIEDTASNRARLISLKVAAGQMSPEEAFRIQLETVTDVGVLASIATGVIDRFDHAKTIPVCRKLMSLGGDRWDVQFYLARALVMEARGRGKRSPEAMALCQEILDSKANLMSPAPVFGTVAANADPKQWAASLTLVLAEKNPFSRRSRVSRTRLLGLYAITQGLVPRAQGLATGAQARNKIRLDSLAHAQTLAAVIMLAEAHRGVPDAEESKVFGEQWKAKFPPPTEGTAHEELLLWRQLVICSLADKLSVDADQNDIRLDVIWRLAELDPLRIAAMTLSLEPENERQAKALATIFRATRKDLCGPDETMHVGSMVHRRKLVKSYLALGQREQAEAFMPELNADLWYGDLVLATQFFLDMGESERAEQAIKFMMSALRRAQALAGGSSSAFDMPIAWVDNASEKTQATIRRHELALIDLVFAGARRTRTRSGGQYGVWGQLGASNTNNQLTPQMIARLQQLQSARRATPIQITRPNTIYSNVTGRTAPSTLAPLGYRLFDASYLHTTTLVATRARGDAVLPESYLKHLERTDFDAPPDELLTRRVFAAFSRWNRGDKENAYASLETIVADYPGEAVLQVELARFAQRLGRLHTALRLLGQVEPEDRDLLICKLVAEATLASKTSNIAQARDAFLALNDLELSADLRMNLVGHAKSLGLTKVATAILERMPQTDTLPIDQQVELAVTVANSGETKLAGEIAFSAFQRLTANRNSRNRRALDKVLALMRSLGRLEPLIQEAELQVRSSPDSIDLQLQLAEYYQLAGRIEDADKIWGNILKRNDFITADRLLARASHLKDVSRNTDAADYYLRMIRESPSRFSQHYSDITRVISRTGRVEDLYEVLSNAPPSLIPAYRIDDLLRLDGGNELTDAKRKFLRNAMSSRTAASILHEVVSALPDGDSGVGKELSRVAITALSRPDAFKPDSSLWQVDSRSTDGIARGPLSALLSLMRESDSLTRATRSAIREASNDDETAPTAEVVTSLMDIIEEKNVAEACEKLYLWTERQRVAQRTSQRLPLSGGLLWQAGHVIANCNLDGASGLAVQLFEAAKCDPKVLSGTDPQYGIMHRLVDAYAEDGWPEKSRRILLDAYHRNSRIITHRTTSSRTIYERLRANQWYAEALFELGYTFDAAMIYRRDTADAAQFEKIRNYGPAIGLQRFASRLRSIESVIDEEDAVRFLELLAKDLPGSQDREAVILCDVSTSQLTRVNDRSRLLKALLTADQTERGRAAVATLANVLAEESVKRPDDWSIPAAQLMCGIVSGIGPTEECYAALKQRLPDAATHGSAERDTEFRIRLRTMFGLYVVTDVAVMSDDPAIQSIGNELTVFLESISEHANRPGMELALSVLGNRTVKASAILNDMDTSAGEEPLDFERTNLCLDMAKHRFDKQDYALSFRAFEIALKRGPPTPELGGQLVFEWVNADQF